MLAPKRVKFRKWQKGRLRGPALRGATIAFGDIGLKTVEHGKLTNQQIEAARIAMMRHIKRGGKVWIRVFPDHPVTAKPLETRQGSGKGAVRNQGRQPRAGQGSPHPRRAQAAGQDSDCGERGSVV